MTEKWLDTVMIRMLREDDLSAIEWNGEFRRYCRIYREIYLNSQKGLAIPMVAETADDGIVGQVFLSQKEPNPDYGISTRYFLLSSFRVKPQFRDRGLGGMLLRECEKQACLHRIWDIYLNCEKNNRRARWFYLSHGFRVIRIDEGKWSYVNDEGFVVTEQQNSYLMKKTLGKFPG